jgi:putative FmdB family regulatory protein
MPIYEYVCGDCAKPFEELVFSASTAVNCPLCGSVHVERQLSTFAARSNGGAAGAATDASPGPMTGGACCGGGCGCR